MVFLDITRQTGKIEDNAYKIEEQDVDIKLEENETKVEMKKECNEIEIDGRNGDFEKDALGIFYISIFSVYCILILIDYKGCLNECPLFLCSP